MNIEYYCYVFVSVVCTSFFWSHPTGSKGGVPAACCPLLLSELSQVITCPSFWLSSAILQDILFSFQQFILVSYSSQCLLIFTPFKYFSKDEIRVRQVQNLRRHALSGSCQFLFTACNGNPLITSTSATSSSPSTQPNKSPIPPTDWSCYLRSPLSPEPFTLF